jgi:multimeric flavodoxin WrbA
MVKGMKVVAINGSPRKNGNTQLMIEEAAKPLRRAGIHVEIVSLRDYEVRPCNACEVCYTKPWHCPIRDDAVKLLRMMEDADGLIVGSPVYGAGVTAQLKALLDRGVIACINQDFRNKVGGAIAVGATPHGGQEFVIFQIVADFAFHGMIVAYPKVELLGAMGTADGRGKIKEDKYGLRCAKELGERMVELMKAKGLARGK